MGNQTKILDIAKFIDELKALPEPRKTFMEIMKVHKSEVHVANLLAFFFRSEEKHGLGKVFLESLFETGSYRLNSKIEAPDEKSIPLIKHSWKLNGNKFQVSEIALETKEFISGVSQVNVKVEEPTAENKRIDLVLKTNKCLVCIEFKISHELINPLKDYQNQIRRLEEKFINEGNEPRDIFFIVLTPYKKESSGSIKKLIKDKENLFREMILSHFVKKIDGHFPDNYFEENKNDIYKQYLVDFIQTIKNREVRYKRSELLKDLCSQIFSKYNGVLDDKHRFILLDFECSFYKIRMINNHQFQIDRWITKKKKDLSFEPIMVPIKFGYKNLLEELNELTL